MKNLAKWGLMALVMFSGLGMLSAPSVVAQDVTVAEEAQGSDQASLAKTFRKAVRNSRKAGDLNWRQAGKLRTFSRLPNGIQQIEDAAVMKMAMDPTLQNVPKTEDGKVDRAQIDWERFLTFLEGLLPLILQLIDALGSVQPIDVMSTLAIQEPVPLSPCSLVA